MKSKNKEIAQKLHSGCLRLLRRLRRVDEKLGMSTARMSALSVLVFKGPCSVSELAEIEQVSKPTMSNLLKGLSETGFVVTKPSTEDRRVLLVYASVKGKRLLQKGQKNRVETLCDMLEPLNKEELETLNQAASIIEKILS